MEQPPCYLRRFKDIVTHMLPYFNGNYLLASFKDPPPPPPPHDRGSGAVRPLPVPRASPFFLPCEAGMSCQYDNGPGLLGVLWTWMASYGITLGYAAFDLWEGRGTV